MKNILQCQDGAAKITALSWSPNNLKLAVCTADRVIILFDDTGERRDSTPNEEKWTGFDVMESTPTDCDETRNEAREHLEKQDTT